MSIDPELLAAIIRLIPGAKVVVPENSGDFNPRLDIGQKHIDYLTEDGNDIFAIVGGLGQLYDMNHLDAFVEASGEIFFSIAFSLPREHVRRSGIISLAHSPLPV